MPHSRIAFRATLVLAVTVAAASPASATTLIRQGLDRLVHDNELVVHGKVLDIYSYWNGDHSFILTDIDMRPLSVIKGRAAGDASDVTFTVMGGAVGDVTVLLVGGPDLVPGSEYVVFLTHARLPGAGNPLTVRDQAQGVFDVERGRATNQAIGDPLLPDAGGRTEVAGGDRGVALDQLLSQMRGYANH